MKRNRMHRAIGLAMGLLAGSILASGCVVGEGEEEEDELDALEGRPESETHDIGCMEFSKANLNTRAYYPGGNDVYMFSVCGTAPRPKIGLLVYESKGATIVFTDPSGNQWQPDSRYSIEGRQVTFVGPAAEGDYLVEINKKGGGANYVVGLANNYYPGSDN